MIDTLCYYSHLRNVNTSLKLFASVISLILCIASRSVLIAMITFSAATVLTVVCGKISLCKYLKLLRIPLVFLFIGTLTIIVNVSPTPMDAFAISIGSFYLTGSVTDIFFCLRLICTAFASVSCLYFLALSTPVTDLVLALRRFHIPPLLIELMLLVYRFIFLLQEIAHQISVAQKSRLGNCNYRTSLLSFGALLSALFIRSVRQSGILFDALEARGYHGEIQVLEEVVPPRRHEIFLFIIFELFLILLWMLEVLLWR